MFNLPWGTHRYLIEFVSNELHVRTILARRFVNFISSIRHSSKNVLRDFLKYVEYDTMSVTGRNLRNISLKTNINDIRMLIARDVKLKYNDIPKQEEYRVNVIKEIVDIRNGQLDLEGFDMEELDQILQYVCCS